MNSELCNPTPGGSSTQSCARVQRPRDARRLSGWRALTSAVAVAAACMGVAACAAAAPYAADNPDHLAAAELSQVAGICHNVLGLSPSERLTSGTWPGDVHLAPVTSHYQGCITSLSDSLQQAGTASAAQSADADCRARGLASGSPALALCVLREEQRPDTARSAPIASAPIATSAGSPSPRAGAVPVGSFFYASGDETVRREQQACASLGFEPPYGQFASCVRNLQATFFAIDNPIE